MNNDKIINTYTVSTAINGYGCKRDTGCTPIGRHKVKLKIGDGCPLGAVFVARRATGEIYTEKLKKQFPERDWILTRIIWLTGLEPGINRYAKVDSLKRYIYIHGTPDSEPMGVPGSKGCIRMRNKDIVKLFGAIDNDTEVIIRP